MVILCAEENLYTFRVQYSLKVNRFTSAPFKITGSSLALYQVVEGQSILKHVQM